MSASRIALTLATVGAGIALGLVSAAAGLPAVADSTTTVIEGQALRLESTADWDAAATMMPGRPVDWDVSVASRMPAGSIVRVTLRAVGDAPLVADVRLCSEEWGPAGCAGRETLLREATDLPGDDSVIPLTDLRAAPAVHLRLTVTLRTASVGSTQVTVGASTGEETVFVRSDGRGALATTGGDAAFAWTLGAASTVLVALGLLLLRIRRPRAEDRDEAPDETPDEAQRETPGS